MPAQSKRFPFSNTPAPYMDADVSPHPAITGIPAFTPVIFSKFRDVYPTISQGSIILAILDLSILKLFNNSSDHFLLRLSPKPEY